MYRRTMWCKDIFDDRHQLKLLAKRNRWRERRKDGTALPHGLSRFTRMLFGLHNHLGTFPALRTSYSLWLNGSLYWVYLDDVVIFSRTPDEQIDHVRQLLTLLNDARVTLNLKKGEIFKMGKDFLGNVVRQGRLEVSTWTIDAICRLKQPSTLLKLWSFLGLRLVQRSPLICTDLHRNGRSLKWEAPCQLQTFEELFNGEITGF